MIYFLLLLTIYVWPFGQLLTFTNPVLPFTIYLLDVMVLLVTFSLVIYKDIIKIFSGPIIKPLLIFFGVAVLSLLINIKQGISSGLPMSIFYLLRLLTYPSLFFAARYVGIKKLKIPLIISLITFSTLGFLQYLVFPDMRFLKNLGFDDHYFRLIGSFYDPNFTGVIFAATALYLICNSYYLPSILLITLLALTFSRASYLVFAFGIIYLLIIRKKAKLLLLLPLLAFLIYLIPKPFGEGVNLLRTFSIFSRFGSWQEGITLFLQRPIIGWGYNTLRGVANSRFQIDSSYIFILATTGIVGLAAFLNLLKTLYKQTFNEGIKVLIIAILIHSLFNNSLIYIWIFAFFWVVLGVDHSKPKGYK
jgi:O-antigen ligase